MEVQAADRTQTNKIAVLCSLLFFSALHVASILISPRFASIYRSLSNANKRDWHGRVVGSTFALAIVLLALPEFIFPGGTLDEDSAYGTSDRANLVCCIAAGFFIWDVVYCACAQQGLPFVFHAAAALFIYAHALQPFQQRWACFFICWEISTPLLNLRAQLIACGLTHTRTFAIANVGFAIMFLLIRWVFGIPLSIAWWADSVRTLREADPRLKPYVIYVTCASNIMLNGLNLFWGGKIVDGIRKLLSGEERTTQGRRASEERDYGNNKGNFTTAGGASGTVATDHLL